MWRAGPPDSGSQTIWKCVGSGVPLGLSSRPVMADAAGSSLAAMMIYLVMALVLALRPRGLLPVRA